LSRSRRPGIWFATAVAAAVIGGAAESAAAQTPSFVSTADCQEHQGFFDGDAAAVAARLPKRFAAELDPMTGRPLLFARAIHCQQVTIDGRTGPATMGSFGIVIQSPDGRGCGSGAPGIGSVAGDEPPVCNWFPLFWVASDRGVVGWLRAGTPELPAVYTPNLSFDLGAVDPARGGAPFHFQASEPTPSPFTMDDVGRERPGEIPIRGGYWADSPQGPIKIAFSTDDLTSGDATGAVRAAHGSEMATVIGAEQASYMPPYSAFAAERWGHASYRKQLLGPSSNTNSFGGSCSLQGQVTFTPPVTNNDASLFYTYDANGTCSGTLDGRTVSNAPVKLHHSGSSYGSCLGAQTTTPGQGTLGFATGEVVRYTLDFTTTATGVDATLYGERSGSASAHGTFLTQRTPPDVTLKCSGEGLANAPLDFSFSTASPLTSDRSSPSGTTTPSHPGQAGRGEPLSLAVTPHGTRLGGRTIFTVHLSAPRGGSVSGAVVRLAGQRVRAGRTGTARIAATFHRPGRRIVVATKPGFRAARTAIRVRRR
jgi:hypothetical protein